MGETLTLVHRLFPYCLKPSGGNQMHIRPRPPSLQPLLEKDRRAPDWECILGFLALGEVFANLKSEMLMST